VIAIARRVTQVFDDGVLRSFLDDATGVAARTAESGFLATAQTVNWTADKDDEQNNNLGSGGGGGVLQRYHPAAPARTCRMRWIHVCVCTVSAAVAVRLLCVTDWATTTTRSGPSAISFFRLPPPFFSSLTFQPHPPIRRKKQEEMSGLPSHSSTAPSLFSSSPFSLNKKSPLNSTQKVFFCRDV
jgi:hypothetical protein